MDVVAILLTVLYMILASLLAILLGTAIYKNIKTGIGFRDSLAREISELRLQRMLSRLGINSNSYLHDQRVHKIKEHISKCDSCENTETCDSRLEEQGDIAEEVTNYCPNAGDLIAIKNASQIDASEST